ncbi:MAG: hypothetical protein AAF665_06320 [Pseudomonadota bacterium]
MRISYIVPLLLIIACTPQSEVPDPDTSLPFFGNGYRADGDQCRRLGESAATIDYLDDAADLVGCPANMENLGVFVTETSAREVARQDGYVIYSVPVR